MKKLFILLATWITSTTSAICQDGIGAMLKSGKDDAKKLFEAYTTPIISGLGNSLNNGWYNTAKPHGLFGFDMTTTVGLYQIPDADKTFNPNNLTFTSLKPVNGATFDNASPTFFGNKNLGPLTRVTTTVNNQEISIDTFNLPSGNNLSYMATLPTAQLAIGIGFKTEVMLRFLPEIRIGNDFKAEALGFGIKHDILQHFWHLEDLPIDLSVIGAYNSFKTNYALSGNNALVATENISGNLGNAAYAGQKIAMDGQGWMAGLILSKKLGPLTIYGGAGYYTYVMNAGLYGVYPYKIPDASNPGKFKYENLSDPVSIHTESSEIKGNIGIRLKFLVFTFHGEAYYSKYPTISAGLGINVQSLMPPKI